MTKSWADETNKGTKGSYASVNGLNMYYEISGSGRPLILLHGGVGAGEMFDSILPKLAVNRQVIAVHLQAHGRTADIDRPLSFKLMADDIAALIKHLGFDWADIMGYSLGASVALQTAIRHPDVVRKLVVVSAPVKRDGWYPEVLEGIEQMTPEAAETMKQTPLYSLYPNADWSKDVATIKSQVMIVFADADSVRTARI